MTDNPPSDLLSADRPLTDPSNDRLGYAPFAKHLAESICKMTPPEGLVVAIYGSWGSGKSTVLEFVVHYLKQMPEDQQPIVVRFNPWWFSGREDLTRNFFNQLQIVLADKLEEVGEKLKERLGKFAKLVSKVPTALIPLPSTLVEPSKEIATLIGELFSPSDVDIAELKQEIEATLGDQPKRILIVIDDIDRLTAEEIRELFRFIKAVADFPNVIYLLAFDKEVVVKALQETQGLPGEAYLEKIIQVPFELPLPGKLAIHHLLLQKLERILGDISRELYDESFLGRQGYLIQIEGFISTPRDVVRLTNVLNVTFPAVKGEVHTADFVAIEAIRIFYPSLYDFIRDNGSLFTGSPTLQTETSSHEELAKILPEKDKTPLEKLLAELFPKLKYRDSVFFGREDGVRWRRSLRICSPDIFDTYFRLSVPETGISNLKMKQIIALVGNAGEFGEALEELSKQKVFGGIEQVSVFLERLMDYTEKDVPIEHIPNIIETFFNLGDKFAGIADTSFKRPYNDNEARMAAIIGQLLRRLEEQDRYDILKNTMEAGQANLTIVKMVLALEHEHGRFGYDRPEPESVRLIGIDHLMELEKIALEKIRQLAKEGWFSDSQELLTVLYIWQELNSEEAMQWVKRNIINENGRLLRFIGKFIGRVFFPGDEISIDLKELSLYLVPSEIIDDVRNISQKDSIPQDQKVVARAFVRSYETQNNLPEM